MRGPGIIRNQPRLILMSAKLTPLPSPLPGFTTPGEGPAKWNILPFPAAKSAVDSVTKTPPLPAWPEAGAKETAAFPSSWPSPLSALPTAQSEGLPARIIGPSPGIHVPPAIIDKPAAHESPAFSNTTPSREPDFTDDDLRKAFAPIVEDAVRSAVFARENGMDTYLEPMLRATIRRALAEYAPASRPFQPPGAFDRFIWHVKALFTSRTYEDIFFEKTRRFQVEEVFLLDAASLALVSFASCDPARHASVHRVTATVHRLTLQLRDDNRRVRQAFEISDGRHVISREGSHVVLMAVVRGKPGEMAFSDLEFALRRIEDHFRELFSTEGSELLLPLQPFLEDCLLIQAPASAA